MIRWLSRRGEASTDDTVRGERGPTVVLRARSLQSRMSNLMAAALVITVGCALLAWYYDETLTPAAASRTAQRSALTSAAQARLPPPPLGPIGRPRLTVVEPQRRAPPAALSALELPLVPRTQRRAAPRGAQVADARGSPRLRALARRLAGAVFASAAGAGAARGARASSGSAPASGASARPWSALHRTPEEASAEPLARLLRPTVLAATRAELLPTRRLLLPKGTFINCTLETAIDSTLPGMSTCVTSTDTFGADGSVVLLERGTLLIGETRAQVRQGEARVFVLWTEARTPDGVVVRLDSPGTDALGRSGLAGEVNRHFWQRFGGAALISVLDGAVQAGVESQSRGGAVIVDPSASADVLNSVLSSTVDIAPTITVANGERIQVLVARNVDFRSVYELEPR